ncbi:MAG: sigma-70 family RNA polymerase sigma factor [Deltaproteobacteria bacterium]|nr:MAG: sigma-70 family RNA polymerase sigma factor [Deltaproteobacteria bacterium]
MQHASCDSLTDEEIVDRVRAGDRAQQAYVDAFAHLGDFAGRARFSTWLTRIAVHEALARKRRQRPEGELMTNLPDPNRSPEQRTQDAETQKLLVTAIDELPEHFRTVFVLRAVQGLSVEETAETLDLNTETVKTRLHRARGLLQKAIIARTEPALARALPFPDTRCDRVVAAVLHRIGVQ